MHITLGLNLDDVRKGIREHREAIQRAAVWTANRTAEEVRLALREKMEKTFFRPTPYVLDAVQVQRATQSDPTARVYVRRSFGRQGNNLQSAVEAQVFGGIRPHKNSEVRIGMAGPGGQPVYMMPARFAKYDANGNPDRGELGIILSQLGVLNRGDNRAARKTKRRRKKQTEYFIVFGRGEQLDLSGNALAPGIYRKAPNGRPLPVYFFMKGAPQYRQRLLWFETAKATVDAKAQGIFDEEVVTTLRRGRGQT